jgi:hypothetical protein
MDGYKAVIKNKTNLNIDYRPLIKMCLCIKGLVNRFVRKWK